MPSIKRPGDEAEGSARKKQLNSTSRTGQACDRCKLRKIRCDARAGGCSPCLQNNTECKTTDRITGRATQRGHTEKIETENSTLRGYVAELQRQLREQGVEPKPAPPTWEASQQLPSEQEHERRGSWDDHTITERTPRDSRRRHRNGGSSATLPGFRAGLIGDNYLGVSSVNSWLSPIEGTSLTLFGMKIDLADFIPQDDDPEASPTSYQTFLKHAFGGQAQVYRPPLHSYESIKVSAHWYFRYVQQYLPVLYQPRFMDLLERMYLQDYQPTPSETVMVHMMLALILFQFSLRNANDQSRQESMQHYHYSLSFVPELIKGHQLQDIQALAMICQLLRSQPRVGAAWMFTNFVLGLAIELGLHRSATAWPEQKAEQDLETVETRKRIFWSLLVLQTTIGGKLGRPMPLRVEDFDIEVPDAVFDNLPDDDNLSDWRKCTFRPATQMMVLTRISMQVWSIIHSVNNVGGPHMADFQHIEKQLQDFKAQIPPELSGGPHTQDEDRVTALYMQMLQTEIRLLMYHPSHFCSMSPQGISDSYDICLQAANDMLETATQLKVLKSFDSTWYYAADFLAAIFTTLFVHTERKEQMTSLALQQVKTDMDAWLDVMTEVGNIMGTGPRLAHAIQGIVDRSISAISRHIAAKTASAAVATTASNDSAEPALSHQSQQPAQQQPHSEPQQQKAYQEPNGISAGYSGNDVDAHLNTQQGSYQISQAGQHVPSHVYPSNNQFTYPSQQNPSLPHFAGASALPPFENAYNGQEDVKPTLDSQLTAHPPDVLPPSHPQHVQNTNFLAFHSPTPAQGAFHSQALNNSTPSQPMAWRNFTDNMMTNMGTGTQNFMHSPNPLMGLQPTSTKAPPSTLDMQAVVASMNQGNMAALGLDNGQQMWPLIYYGGDGTGGTG